MTPIVLRDVEIDGALTHVHVREGRIVALDRSAPPPRAEVVDGAGGTVLPGLWDHHAHLLALAAARCSVVAGPPTVVDGDGLARAMRAAVAARATGEWIRAVGYHERVAGPIDRAALDRLVPAHPVRVQHRSGSLWVLNTAAIERLGLAGRDHPGLERRDGELTGRLFGGDEWLRSLLDGGPPDLRPVGAELASYGVTGVTDATPFAETADLELLALAGSPGAALPQTIVATGGPALTRAVFPAPLRRGPVKLVLADHALPELDTVAQWIADAHAEGRRVAVHAVTRASLVLALAAWELAGAEDGDRVEHGAVVPPELRERLAAARLTVVTQPNFVAERGDEYRAEVDREDLPHLYPCRSLLEAGVRVAAGTDAPFGNPDPWRAIAAARDRTSPSGAVVGADERIAAAAALALFLGPPDDPGGPCRRVSVGGPGDLCLLDGSLREVLHDPTSERVRATLIGGRVAHHR